MTRQALDVDNTSAFAYDSLSNALRENGRLLEAVDAAKTALRLSDGKYGFAHFTLGSAYFDLERWEESSASFQMAAQLDATNAAAALNAGLALFNDKKLVDAVYWLEQALKRNPSPAVKQKAERLLAVIR